MRRGINVEHIDFEMFLDNTLKSYGYLFPETDEQMEVFEKTVELKELPLKFQNSSFVFDKNISILSTRRCTDAERAIVAGHIINKCNTDDFGRVKFQKLLYLVEHVFQLDFDSNYERKAAGPHDHFLLSRIETTLQQYHFYKIPQDNKDNRRVHYEPLSSAEELSDLFSANFVREKDSIDQFLSQFKKATWQQCEIVATLYAVWNNRIIRKQEISDILLKQDFLDWDPHKAKYKDRIDRALKWMKDKNVIPIGWGKAIK